MTFTAKRFILMLALAVMPLQGVAAVFTAMTCLAGQSERVVQEAPAEAGHGLDAQHDETGGGTVSQTDHFNCHLVVSGLPGQSPQEVMPHIAVRGFLHHFLYDPFFPDRPQRPPLA